VLGQLDDAIEPFGQLRIMTHEDQCATLGGNFLKQQVKETIAIVGVEGRSRFVGDENFWAADERSGNSNPLLLPNAEFGDRCLVEIVAQAQGPQKVPCRLLDCPCAGGPVSFAVRETA
jgi:hypothetical protein